MDAITSVKPTMLQNICKKILENRILFAFNQLALMLSFGALFLS